MKGERKMARHNPILEENVEIPNTVGTELQTTVQQNNQAMVQPNVMQNQPSTPNPNSVSNVQQQNTQQQNTQQNTQQNIQQNIQQQQPIQSNPISIQRPSDFVDQTVQGYLNDYDYGVSINDYQAQINALTALDKYRVQNGYDQLYTNNVYELMNLRTQKIKDQIRNYENQISYANSMGDYGAVQTLGQELENYKRSVNYRGEGIDNSANYLANMQEYRSAYDSTIDSIVSELLTMRFTYNPNEDEALLKAQEYATNKAYESMNAKGMLYSSMTAQIVTNTIANLETQYRKMAKEEFYENVDRLKSMANFIIDLDDRAYQRWQNETARNLEYYSALRDEMDFQNKRVEQMGYVDNTASIVLGIPVGTLSASTRKAISEAQAEKEKEYNKLYSDIALAEAKAQINAQYSQQTDYVKTQNAINEYLTKKEIDAQYKTTTDNGFSGNLNSTALMRQMQEMWNRKASETEIIKFARDNAKSEDAYATALAGNDSTFYKTHTLQSANELLQQEDEYQKAHNAIQARMDLAMSMFAPTNTAQYIYDYYEKNNISMETLQRLLNDFGLGED